MPVNLRSNKNIPRNNSPITATSSKMFLHALGGAAALEIVEAVLSKQLDQQPVVLLHAGAPELKVTSVSLAAARSAGASTFRVTVPVTSFWPTFRSRRLE